MNTPSLVSIQPRYTLGQAVALILSWLDEDEANTQTTPPAKPNKPKTKRGKQ